MTRVIALLLIAMTLAPLARAETPPEIAPRTALEKDWVLAKMRLFLEAIHGIADGLAREDAAAVARIAAAQGKLQNTSFPDRPTTLPAKESAQWKSWANAVRVGFDQLAASAQAGEPVHKQLTILTDITANCTACHATYHIEVSP